MDIETVVSPSAQVTSTLPRYIIENYSRFIEFMEEASKGQERRSFGQDLLQNLLDYRDFSTYDKQIRQFDYLKEDVGEGGISGAQGIEVLGTSDDYSVITDEAYEIALGDTSTRIFLTNADGFPRENGIILIEDEVILYRQRDGNILTGLLRGASATSILPSFTSSGTYLYRTSVSRHTRGTKVHNLSVLFMVSMLDTIHQTFIPGLSSTRFHPDVTRSPLLRNIKDFYQSKGNKLGIKAFFKMLFGENDVQVRYPGDQMIKPSQSTWIQNQFLRTVPVPKTLCDPTVNYGVPSKITSNEIIYKSYLDKVEKNVYARAVTDFVSTYMFEDEIQYEFSLVSDTIEGDFIANPNTVLTRALESSLTAVDDRVDVSTITVESTLGFPDKGLVFIGNEGILYNDKSFNQFFNCVRAYRGVESPHEMGTKVFGPYFIESSYVENGETYVTRSWPMGLVSDVRVDDGGILHSLQDEVTLNGPGRVDYREPILHSFNKKENFGDKLATTNTTELPFIGNYTWGVNGVYFDHKHVFVASSNLPDYSVGLFSTNNSVGDGLQGEFAIHIIPRRETIQPNDNIFHKGVGGIGIFVDGVPAYSNVSEDRLYQGRIIDFTILNQGEGYVTPTVLLNDEPGGTEIEVDPNLGHIISITPVPVEQPDGDMEYKGYSGNPQVRITSGENGQILLRYDVYGRITSASIINQGQYYYDVPRLFISDRSGRGKGAALNCTVNGRGGLATVEVSHSGLDYNPSTTSVVIQPMGDGANVLATVEYYEFNRWDIINNAPNQFFDAGNGFLYPGLYTAERNKYAYIADPSLLREQLNDKGYEHSPLIGWAFDGNPIYGPYGYRDAKTPGNGLVRQKSGYKQTPDRTNMVPANGTEPGQAKPDSLYPRGTFIQDYYWDNRPFDSETVDGNDILDIYNGKVCNTPEFPVELYPDGVYCYFITVEADGEPAFPYIMGHTFKNQPISQTIDLTDYEPITPVPFKLADPSATYDIRVIDFDFTKVERYRNPYLESTKEGIKLEVSDISQGHVSGIQVEDGAPYNRVVGDYLFFNDDQTQGMGAVGRITHLWGEEVDENYGIRNATQTRLISHRQLIDLRHYTNLHAELGASRKVGTIKPGQQPSELLYPADRVLTPIRTGDFFVYTESGTAWNGEEVRQNDWVVARGFGSNVVWKNERYYSDGELVFIEGNSIYTSSGAESVIESYENQLLIVHTNTPNLILPGDTFFDARNYVVEILGTGVLDEIARYDQFDLIDETPPSVGVNTYYDDNLILEDESNIQTGDLWWSEQTGRLYVFYAGEWICTQPLGTRPMVGALDKGIGTTAEATEHVTHYQTERTVTISTTAPRSRDSDGNALVEGDLWWSNQTGILYIFYNDVWVCTDPNGSVPIDPYDAGGRDFTFATDPGSVIAGQKVIVSFRSPTDYAPLIGGDSADPSLIETNDDPDADYDGVTVEITPVGEVSDDQGRLIGRDDPEELVTEGTLWWSPGSIGTGMMYIRYDNRWCVTNPVGTLSSEYSLETSAPDGGGQFPGGNDGTGGGGGVMPLPELPDQPILYFINTTTFEVGDVIEFKVGAPGVEPNEKAKIRQKLPQNGLIVERGVEGTNAIEIPDGTKTENVDNYVYLVRTKDPHGLNDGDEIFIEDSRYEEINGRKLIDRAGKVELAFAKGTISNGQVTGVDFNFDDDQDDFIERRGKNYPQNVIVKFVDGGGIGGRGVADVDPVTGSILDVTITNPGEGYFKEPNAIFGDELPADTFILFTTQFYEYDDLIKYSHRRTGIQGEAAYAEVLTGGVGYQSMPPIIGSYPEEVDRAVVEITTDILNDRGIDNVEILSGGNRYVNPTVIFWDEDARGYGAEGTVQVENGEITGVTITNPGEGYIEPKLIFVEQDGKYIPTTETIGSIRGFRVVDPGRALSADRSLKPEILITTKCIVSPLDDSVGDFVSGSIVYQGTNDYRMVSAEVVDYQEDKQIIILRNVDGNLKDNEVLYQENTETKALVVKEGQADCSIVVDADSAKIGRWHDDTSMVSSELAVVQDSYYYQWFSYVIDSPLPVLKYKTFVDKSIHPAGFQLFADLRIKSEVNCNVRPDDFENVPITDGILLGPDGANRTNNTAVKTVLAEGGDIDTDTPLLGVEVDEDVLDGLDQGPPLPDESPIPLAPGPTPTPAPTPTPTPAPTPAPTPDPTPDPAPSPSPSPSPNPGYGGY